MKRYGYIFFIGLIFFVVAFLLLFINESNFVNSIKIVDYVQKNAIELSTNSISPANDGKIVHVSGKIYSNQTLSDGVITIPNAIALFRNTEMYQWSELKKERQSETTFRYRKIWSRKLINSDNFNDLSYKNPKAFKYPPRQIYANNVGLGRFYLSSVLVKQIKTVNKIQQLPYRENFKIYNGFYFTGENYDTPQIGAQKLFYSYIPSGIFLSVIAQQTGNHLEPLSSKYENFAMVINGEKNLTQMTKEYTKTRSNQAWLYRGIGIFLMFLGLNLIIQPLISDGDKVPFLGKLTQMQALVVTLILTLAFGVIVISFGWIILYPEIAIPLIVLAILAIFSLKRREKIVIPE